MSMEDCFTKTRQLDYRRKSSYWNNATYNVAGNRFKGDTGIILRAKTWAVVVDSAVVTEAKAQYVLLAISSH